MKTLYKVHSFGYSLYMNLLELCIKSKSSKSKCCHMVHSHILTNGFGLNVNLNTKLIIFYSKSSDMEAARKVFDKMTERDIVSWTALISGYCQSGYHKDALLMFVGMRREGFRANQFAYCSALRACTRMRCLNEGMQIQCCIQKGRFGGNLFVQSALIDFHSKCGRIESAWNLFETTSRKDLAIWNAMIGGYAVKESAQESLHLLKLMMREGITPDYFTLGNVLKSCAGGNGLRKVMKIHKLIIQLGFVHRIDLNGSLVNAYAKCGSIQTAHFIYRQMGAKDLISCTALMTAYTRESVYCAEVLGLFKELLDMQVKIDDFIICSVLHLCANMASLSLGRQVHALILKYQHGHDVAMGNALVNMYAKSGELKDADRAFREMPVKNVISWTSLIVGYGVHGFGREAVSLYKQMQSQGLKPTDVTFLGLLFACSHTGLTSEGWECFNEMVSKYCLSPRSEHFSCLVDISARSGQLDDAYQLIHQMDIKTNTSLWGSILNSCRLHSYASLGEAAAVNLISNDPMNPANYILLANIYAEAGVWDSVYSIRKMMEERGLAKYPGHSLLEIPKKNDAFLHPT